MRFRKLRIAWSVLCAMACVLLIVLWVRSYWKHDYLFRFNTNVYSGFESDFGRLSFNRLDFRVFPSRRHAIQAWTFAVIPPTVPDADRRTFQWAHMTGMLQVVAPHWFVFMSTATVATVPWIRRFSLRALLVVMTVVGVVLGVIAYGMR